MVVLGLVGGDARRRAHLRRGYARRALSSRKHETGVTCDALDVSKAEQSSSRRDLYFNYITTTEAKGALRPRSPSQQN